MRRVLFAGGGTAGHIEPALAVAREWRRRYPEDEIVFVGTSEGLENKLVPAAQFELRTIPKVVMPRRVNLNLVKLPFSISAAVSNARKVIAGSDLIIGFGGYVSAPIYLAAKAAGIPFVIHEANAKPGWANRLGSLLTSYLAVAQPVGSTKFEEALITGIPLRADVHHALVTMGDWKSARLRAKSELGFSSDERVVVIMGGSQGSIALNSTIAQSLDIFRAHGASVLHSCGSRNQLPESQPGYRPVHYITEMAHAYLAADLIIARSGAITCSEINALGRYALFIPLPVGNGEQRFNANSLIEQGRAEIIDQGTFTREWLERNMDRLLTRSAQQSEEGSMTDRDAAEKIANLMEYALVAR